MKPKTIITIALLGLIGYQVLVLALLALFPYVPDLGLLSLNATIYSWLEPLTIVLTLGLLYAWLARILGRWGRRGVVQITSFLRQARERLRFILRPIGNMPVSEAARRVRIMSRPKITLATGLVISTLLPLVPYRPDLNPSASLVGVDSPLYLGWLQQMLALPLPQAIHFSFVSGLEGSRPLLLLLLYFVSSIGISPTLVIEFLPVVLSPLLTLSTFVFVKTGFGSAETAGLTSILTPVSFYTTVGLWGGYYANWLALIFVYLFLASLLIYLRGPSLAKYGVMWLLSLATFLAHPWTWALIASACLVYGLAEWRETRKEMVLGSIMGIVATSIVLDVVKSLVFTTRSVGVDVVGTFAAAGVGQLANSWPNLVEALTLTHSSLLANWLLLGAGMLGMLALRWNVRSERLLMLWVIISSVPFLFMDSYHQARILYNLPMPALASIAAVGLAFQIEKRSSRWSSLAIILGLATLTGYALQGVV
ncbi:MAG TPA: hypothetical protein VFV92_12420, partial [Candidatus Bathyarchaeia archaeon]|nr:hypothetical protein [Candidatus Bathyarchaeia archaeon]